MTQSIKRAVTVSAVSSAILIGQAITGQAFAQEVNTISDLLNNGTQTIATAANFVLSIAAVWGIWTTFRAVAQMKRQADSPGAAQQGGNPFVGMGMGMAAVGLSALIGIIVNTGLGENAADSSFERAGIFQDQ